MSTVAAESRRLILVTRPTRLEELVQRHASVGQARFSIERLGGDWGDFLLEHEHYQASLAQVQAALQHWPRTQRVDKRHLPNFIFGADDIVIALGQDGLVANTMKYLEGQPLMGVNPDPLRWDGLLLPFRPDEMGHLLKDVMADRRSSRAVTMAQAQLADGQVLRAVNDLFIGPRSHTSALYDLHHGEQAERQSSSGIIVCTGLGSTAWMRSVFTGSLAIAAQLSGKRGAAAGSEAPPALAWDAPALMFAVREPFPSKTSSTELVFGKVTTERGLSVRSRMPDTGVIFSDGIEADFLRFPAGMEAVISTAPVRGQLVQ